MVRPNYWPNEGMPERTEPFTWIIKGKMAVSWWPDASMIEKYRSEGIKVIINCSEFDNRQDIPKDFKYFHINIPDFGTPTEAQIERFFKITDENGTDDDPIVVHCVAGCGRSGLMVVAWATYNNYIPKGIDPVKWIRKLRSCCLETKKQMELVRNISNKYHK